MTATLPELVADALFNAELPPDRCTDSYVGQRDAEVLATVALRAARAQGWRIVKTGVTVHEREDPASGPTQALAFIVEEWTGA